MSILREEATGVKYFIAIRSHMFRCTTRVQSLEFTTHNSRHSRVLACFRLRGIYRDRLMQIIIVVIILRGFLGVRVSPRIYRGCIKARVHDRSTIARCFNTVFPNRYGRFATFLSCNLISIINSDWIIKCLLHHRLFLYTHAFYF